MSAKVSRIVGICGVDHRPFSIAFREMETRLGFVSVAISIRIHLFHARFSLLYEVDAFEQLKQVIEGRLPLASELYDADGILRLDAVACEHGVIWGLEWKGIYPAYFSNPEQENAVLRIQNLRVRTGDSDWPDV